MKRCVLSVAKRNRSSSYAQEKDGTIKEVKMIREEVAIEDTLREVSSSMERMVKNMDSSICQVSNADFEDAKGRNASDDIKAENSLN